MCNASPDLTLTSNFGSNDSIEFCRKSTSLREAGLLKSPLENCRNLLLLVYKFFKFSGKVKLYSSLENVVISLYDISRVSR